jgi:ribosomal protein S18 acetylase RimI-like enzyme
MIRKAKPSEIDKIITLTQACAQKMLDQEIYQWNDQYPSISAFEMDNQREELYVLLEMDKLSNAEILIGCITISTLKDMEYNAIDWCPKDGLSYYIHRLAVHPNFQHRGNAIKLMNYAEVFAKNKGALSVRLDTFSLNLRNQKFYENRGYQRLGEIYFPRQSDAPFYCYELVFEESLI